MGAMAWRHAPPALARPPLAATACPPPQSAAAACGCTKARPSCSSRPQSEYDAGSGTCVRGDFLTATLVGTKRVLPPAEGEADQVGSCAPPTFSPALLRAVRCLTCFQHPPVLLPPPALPPQRPRVEVVRSGAEPVVPAAGDVVTARVIRINARLAAADILCVGQRPVRQRYSGVIRLQDVRATEIDKVGAGVCGWVWVGVGAWDGCVQAGRGAVTAAGRAASQHQPGPGNTAHGTPRTTHPPTTHLPYRSRSRPASALVTWCAPRCCPWVTLAPTTSPPPATSWASCMPRAWQVGAGEAAGWRAAPMHLAAAQCGAGRPSLPHHTHLPLCACSPCRRAHGAHQLAGDAVPCDQGCGEPQGGQA